MVLDEMSLLMLFVSNPRLGCLSVPFVKRRSFRVRSNGHEEIVESYSVKKAAFQGNV